MTVDVVGSEVLSASARNLSLIIIEPLDMQETRNWLSLLTSGILRAPSRSCELWQLNLDRGSGLTYDE